MQVRAYIVGERVELKKKMKEGLVPERNISGYKGERHYLLIDELTFLSKGKMLDEAFADIIVEVTVSGCFPAKQHIQIGLYREDCGVARLDQRFPSPEVSLHDYLSWGSGSLKEALELYNGIRGGVFKPADGSNWEVGDSAGEPEESDAADTMLPE